MLGHAMFMLLFALTACAGNGQLGEREDPRDDSEIGDETEPPIRPVNPDPGDQRDPVEPEEGEEEEPQRRPSLPGAPCSCDQDCATESGFAPLCIDGICGALGAVARCRAGSTEGCPSGHRCWSGTGVSVCYPDFDASSCSGREDPDGSCVAASDQGCYRVCGELCDLPGEPPDWENDEAAEGPCSGVDDQGECRGTVLRWCEGDVLREQDCAASGRRCGWLDDAGEYLCIEPEPDDEPEPVEGGEGCDHPVVIAELALTNEARRRAGVSELLCDEGLTRAAYLHSLDMCERRYFSHTSRDGRSHSHRISEQGVVFSTSGENIAWGQTSAEEVHRTWMNSFGHRRNILSGSYRRIGIGYEPCGGSPYWTQNFTD